MDSQVIVIGCILKTVWMFAEVNTGFPRHPDDEIPGLLQDFSRTLFFHTKPLADADVYGKYDTRIGDVIWHDHHKAVSE